MLEAVHSLAQERSHTKWRYVLLGESDETGAAYICERPITLQCWYILAFSDAWREGRQGAKWRLPKYCKTPFYHVTLYILQLYICPRS
jgi:hypothetical protein